MELRKAILRTVAYYDLLEYPLTSTEIWKWLYKPACPPEERTLAQVAEALKTDAWLAERLSLVEGFYCFKGREHLVLQRKDRNLRTDELMRKALRITKLLRLFPAIRMVALSSSVTYGNVSDKSDIDLFIVTRPGQIWLARFCAAGMLKLLRQRPSERVTSNKVCLSFYITDDALDVSSASYGNDDIVFHYYIQSFMPLYDLDNVYPKFLAANAWWSKALPHAYFPQYPTETVSVPGWLEGWHAIFTWVTKPFLHPRQEWYCNLQLKIMPARLKSIANIDPRVIISDTMLKFHDKDNRHELRKRWLERIAEYA